MTDLGSEVWFDSVAKVVTGIEGVKATFAGGRGGQGEDVQPMTDEDLWVTPAAVLSFAGGDVKAGVWTHLDFELSLDIWVDREPVSISYAECIAFIQRVMAALAPHAKAYNTDPAVQHLLPMSFGRIVPRAWPESSPHQYLVLPVTLQVRLARAAIFQPA